jgi:protein TonB
MPESMSASESGKSKITPKTSERQKARSLPKPPIVIPARPTIATPPPVPPAEKPLPILEMSKEDMAAADVRNLPKANSGSGSNDSEVVGHGPHGEVLYAAEWARHPSDAELGGYLPPGAPDGYGLIACKTIPGNRVEDCIELDQEPPGSHLASAVRQAAWQFRIRPPRKNGVPLVGEWVEIRIDYEHVGRSDRL